MAEDKNKIASSKQISLDDAIAEAEVNLAALKAKKAYDIKAKQRKAKEAAEQNDKRPKYEHTNGLKYRFKKTCPDTLNIDGSPKKTTEIIKDKALMTDLIVGRSNFVEPVNL